MNGFGDQFLPVPVSPMISVVEGTRAIASIGHHVADRGADTHEVLERDSRSNRFIGSGLQQDFRHAHGSMNPGCQIHGVVRFDDIIKRPVAHGIDHRFPSHPPGL